MKVYPIEETEYKHHQEERHVSNFNEYEVSFWNEDVIKNHINLLQGPILDVGCRNGKLLDTFKEMGIEAKGIEITDIADFGISQGRDIYKGDIQKKTPWPDKYFKTIIASHVVEHFLYPEDAIKEMARILSGYLIIHVPLVSTKETLHNYSEYVSFESIEDVCNLLIRHGFIIEEVGEKNDLNQKIIAKI